MVGRDDDLAQLELVARRAFSERRPFLVNLVAPAGTGKTRLVEEFLDRLPRLAPAARTAIAQCLPYGCYILRNPNATRSVPPELMKAAHDKANVVPPAGFEPALPA